MQEVKKQYQECIDKARSICTEQDIDSSLLDELDKLHLAINNFKIFMPLVGDFNAGKTSLINALLNREKLFPVKITPTTAIATEIHYSAKECLKVYGKKNGDDKKIAINDLNTLNVADYQYTQAFVDNQIIKDNNEIVIVDMPGLNSGIEQHRSAIQHYMKKSSYYILVIAATKGEIKRNTLEFISEYASYDLELSVILNKTDGLAKDSQILDVTKNIEESLTGQGYGNIKINHTSVYNDDIKGFEGIISSIDKVAIFKKVFKPQILNIIAQAIEMLNTRLQTMSINSEKFDESIKKLTNDLNELDNIINNEKKRLHRKFSDTTVENIVTDCRKTLSENVGDLKVALQVSPTALEQRINDLIRPKLVSSSAKYISVEFNRTCENVANKISTGLCEFSNFVTKNQDVIATSLTDIQQFCQRHQTRPAKPQNNELQQTASLATTAVLGVAGALSGGVLTALEAVVAVLPMVVSVLGELFGGDQQSQQPDLTSDLQFSIIPNVCVTIGSNIRTDFDSKIDELFSELQKATDARKQRITDSIEKVQNEKEQSQIEIETSLEQCKIGIQQLTSITVQ